MTITNPNYIPKQYTADKSIDELIAELSEMAELDIMSISKGMLVKKAVDTITQLQVELKKMQDIACLNATEVVKLWEADRWIPVGERLPEPNKFVLVYAPKFKNVFECYVDRDCGNWRFAVSCYDITQPVTHWKPLPQPPKEATKC